MIKNKLVGNIVSLGSVQIINYIFPLITVPYISRIIGPEGYGVINYSTSFITYFAILIAYGFDLSVTRRIAHETHSSEKVSQVVSKVFTCKLILIGFATIFFTRTIFFSPIQDGAKNILHSIYNFLFKGKSYFKDNLFLSALSKMDYLNTYQSEDARIFLENNKLESL